MVKFKDYYQILNVKRDASGADVKSAYRRLARQYHPDLNPGNEQAAERFREVQEAYDVLGEESRRRRYDALGNNYSAGMDFKMPSNWASRPGAAPSGPAAEAPRSGFSEFFEMLFGGSRSRQRSKTSPGAAKGADIETVLAVSLEDLRGGVRKKVRYHVNARCTACQGAGVVGGSTCGACNGKGVAPVSRDVEIVIPPTVGDGARLRVAGQGHPPANGSGQPGDMHVRIQIQPHPVFQMKGRNIHVSLPVAPWEAVLGGEVEVPTLEGMVTMKLPPGSPTGMKMRLRERGLPTETGRGDEIVTIQVVTPSEVTDREKHLFRQLRDISRFRPRVKDRSVH